jgi:hypothetical protein
METLTPDPRTISGEYRNPADKTWTFLMEHKNKDGKWTTFAEDKLRRP